MINRCKIYIISYSTFLNIIYFCSFSFLAGFMLFNQIILGLFPVLYYVNVIGLFIFINKKVFNRFILLYEKRKRNIIIIVNEKKIEAIMSIGQKQVIFFYGLHLLMYIINKVVLYKIKKKCLNIY